MFIDEAEITVAGGSGGNGKVAFFAMKSGPSGGNGGKGGDVYFVLNTNLVDLKKYTEKLVFNAEDGQEGGSNKRLGRDGKDLLLPVPLGTTIFDINSNQETEINRNNPKVLLCKGGKGGYGNEMFKTSTYQTPRRAELGAKGQERQIKLILRLIADYGLIGLPNAGKSTLLNELTAANVKTADYPFTTLEPNLGVFNGKVLADIPGLIEGASAGKGLGIKFLKHIEKVRLLLHCVAADSDDIKKDYQTVIRELGKYNPNLLNKRTVILLTKTDLLTKEAVNKKINQLLELNKKTLGVSVIDNDSLNKLKKYLLQ